MKKIYAISTVVGLCIASAACTQNEQRTAGYGVGGAALGALAGGAISGSARGAMTGAALGAAGGSIYGTSAVEQDRGQQYYRVQQPRVTKVHKVRSVRYCDYKDSRGETYRAPC